MSSNDPNTINRLIGRFMDLHEQWESAPQAFSWDDLQTLAREGASAYNEGGGPSFHALALDGTRHSEFHERFLGHSLDAGFDPFRLVATSSAKVMMPVISHDGLAQAALSNESSARMRSRLMEIARERFGPIAQAAKTLQPTDERLLALRACPESVPLDLLAAIAPELVESHSTSMRSREVDPAEGRLTTAEAIAERHSEKFG